MIQLNEPEVKYFVNYCLLGGAEVIAIDTGIRDQMWPGQCNPSILWDDQRGEWLFLSRNVNYILHGSGDYTKSWTNWGPILYSIPQEDGRNLKTKNYIATVKDLMNDKMKFQLIETTPYTPQWEFQGEEDARLVRWNGKLYTTGVRRDDNIDGHGRMELMELTEDFKEVSRLRVKSPNNDENYCEKNWMPILDMPFHYVQFTNPTIIYKIDPQTGDIEKVLEKPEITHSELSKYAPLRGSSQVIPYKNGHMALTHTCELWNTATGRKFARYNHVFIVWDEDWNIIHISPVFSFADYNIEFTCGLSYKDGFFYIPFALQDNFTFIVKVDENVLMKFIQGDSSIELADKVNFQFSLDSPVYLNIFLPHPDKRGIDQTIINYFNRGFLAASYCISARAFEQFDNTYFEHFYAARSVADSGHRDDHEIAMWMHCVREFSSYPETYFAIAMYHLCRSHAIEAFYWAERGMIILQQRLSKGYQPIYYNIESMQTIYARCERETQLFEQVLEPGTPQGQKVF